MNNRNLIIASVVVLVLAITIGVGFRLGTLSKKCPVCPTPDALNIAKLSLTIERMKADSALAAQATHNAEQEKERLLNLIESTEIQVKYAYPRSRSTAADRIMRDLGTNPPPIPKDRR